MSPRTEIIAVDLFDSIENLKLFIETGLFKIVVSKFARWYYWVCAFIWFV
jgi:CBS domain containing-hemolysin-like protein